MCAMCDNLIDGFINQSDYYYIWFLIIFEIIKFFMYFY